MNGAPALFTADVRSIGAGTDRDPLRLTVLRALACVLFQLHALRRIDDDVSGQAELLADDVAAGDRPVVLASAFSASRDGHPE